MSLTIVSVGASRCHAGESDVHFRPSRGFQPNARRGALYSHHAGATGLTSIDYSANGGTARLVDAIAQLYPVAASDLGGASLVGNPTAQARHGEAVTWLRATSGDTPRADNTKPVIGVGVSNGVAGLINYFGYDAATGTGHVADLAGLVLVLPLWDMDYGYQNNAGGVRPLIEAALGITYPTALPAHADPKTNMTLIAAANIPTRIYYSGTSSPYADPLNPAAVISAMVAAFGNNVTAIDVGGAGHNDTSIDAIDRPNLLAWLNTVAVP